MSRKRPNRHTPRTPSTPERAAPVTVESQRRFVNRRHTFWGVFSCLLPIVNAFMLVRDIPGLSLLTTPLGMTFVYGISPIAVLAGWIIPFLELRKDDRKHLFPWLGIFLNTAALLAMLFYWIVALELGYPLVCIDKPSFCFR